MLKYIPVIRKYVKEKVKTMGFQYTFDKDPTSIFVGFSDLDAELRATNAELNQEVFDPTHFPPHNIFKVDDTKYLVEMYVPGYKPSDISVNIANGVLSVAGTRTVPNTSPVFALVTNPATFSKFMRLADNIIIDTITTTDGVMAIILKKAVIFNRDGNYAPNFQANDTPAIVANNAPVAIVNTAPTANVVLPSPGPGPIMNVVPPNPPAPVQVNVVDSNSNTSVPIVVTTLDPMPPIVTANVSVDSANNMTINLTDSSNSIANGARTVVPVTDKVSVAIDPAKHMSLSKAGIDIAKVVEAAMTTANVRIPK